MKRTFLKVLPFAAALLLATSCSKDENTSVNDEVIDNSQQIENVIKTFKTLTVKGKVNKSISKVTVVENTLAFEGGEEFTFGSNTEDVYGTINFTGTDGSYTATINYTDEQYLNGSFIATLGENPDVMSTAYDNLAAAVKNAYYTIDFTITQNEGEYKLKSGDASDIVVNLQSAFIKALAGNTEKLGGEDITVEAGKYYIVPVGKTMGESSSSTVAGKIYSLGSAVPEGYVDLGVTVGTRHIYFEKSETYSHSKWQGQDHSDWPTVEEWTALKDQCYWKLADDNGGYYVFKVHDNNDAGKVTNSSSSSSTPSSAYSTDTDPYIFLPVTDGDKGYYWSSESAGGNIAFCLYFDTGYVGTNYGYSKGLVMPGVVTVRRSN